MKRTLLIISTTLLAFTSKAQTIFNVEAPSSVTGTYNFIYADPTDGWGVADLTDPANSFIDTLVLGSDGTAADSLGCNFLVNGAEVSGQIAVIYRGDCEFGTKAYNAQQAGAVAVVLINNDGDVNGFGMLGGADGPNVTIPVVMISEADGAILREAMATDDVVVFIGNKSGYYENDLTTYPSHILRANRFSNIQRVCQDSNEFAVNVGSWIYNYGVNNQTGVSLSAEIDLGGSVIYTEVSDTFSLASGDSTFVLLPRFAQSSYDLGYYHMTYTITSDSTDDYMNDNMIGADFYMSDEILSLAPVDSVNEFPISSSHYRTVSRGLKDNQKFCIHFKDPNASRLGVVGMNFSAVRVSDLGTTLVQAGDYVQIFAYEWTDNFVGLSDAAPNTVNYNEISSGDYYFSEDLQDTSLYVPFFDNFALEDNKRYLFCLSAFSDSVYYGMNANIDYTANVGESSSSMFDQPISPIFGESGSGSMTWFLDGFNGFDLVPALSVKTIDAATVGVKEEVEKEIKAYPNPANNYVTIPFSGLNENSIISVYDMSGKMIASKTIIQVDSSMNFDVSDIPNGMYTFTLSSNEGKNNSFKVVINR